MIALTRAAFAALLLLFLNAQPVQGEWSRQLPWRIAEAKVQRERAWQCERNSGLRLSAYPAVRWGLPVQQRRYRTLNYWRSRLNICRAHRESIGNLAAWLCIKAHEGDWEDGGDPYWGGLQADRTFMRTYGADMLRKYGEPRGRVGANGWSNAWTPREQMVMAERARASGRGFYPWPTSARICGLI